MAWNQWPEWRGIRSDPLCELMDRAKRDWGIEIANRQSETKPDMFEFCS
jgi:hypothetical protein